MSTLRESWLLSGSEVSPWLGEAREVTPGQSLPIPEEHPGGACWERGGDATTTSGLLTVCVVLSRQEQDMCGGPQEFRTNGPSSENNLRALI